MKNTLGDPTCRGFRELIRSLAVSRDENALAPEDSDGREVVEHNFYLPIDICESTRLAPL